MQEIKAPMSGDFKPTPTVSVKEKVGTFFEGKFMSYKELPSQYEKPWQVYDFELIKTDMPITVKNGAAYTPAVVIPGENVAIFAPTRLHNILKGILPDTDLRIEYTGMVKAGKKGGRAHTYKVFAL